MVAPSVNVLFGNNTFEEWRHKDHLNLLQTSLNSILPEGIKTYNPERLKEGVLTDSERSGLLALHRFLQTVDPDQARIGLRIIPTYTGDFAWVCKKHYEIMKSKIPEIKELDHVTIGTNDLSQSMGKERNSPDVLKMASEMTKKAQAVGLSVSVSGAQMWDQIAREIQPEKVNMGRVFIDPKRASDLKTAAMAGKKLEILLRERAHQLF